MSLLEYFLLGFFCYLLIYIVVVCFIIRLKGVPKSTIVSFRINFFICYVS